LQEVATSEKVFSRARTRTRSIIEFAKQTRDKKRRRYFRRRFYRTSVPNYRRRRYKNRNKREKFLQLFFPIIGV